MERSSLKLEKTHTMSLPQSRRRRMTIRAEGPQLSPEWREGKCQERGTNLQELHIGTQECDHVGRVPNKKNVEQVSPILQAVLDFVPESTLQLDKQLFVECLQTAPSGCAPGPGGCTNEMLHVCLDDHETLELLTSAAEDYARVTVPDEARKSFMLPR